MPPEARGIIRSLSPSIEERLLEDTTRGVHARCTGNASVWDSPDLQETFSIMNPFGSGWHLDRAVFDESLREHIRALCIDGVAEGRMILTGDFISVQKDDNIWAVKLHSVSVGERTYYSKWLVDASGRKASVSQKVHVVSRLCNAYC